ncbi:M48 family metallopeptidase [Candidatus Desantisbacteria bacterium]|nr:M48 family metallopeptidase [Candidatus Desantisbacteria bacterium]
MNKKPIKTKEELKKEINYLAGKLKVKPKQIRIQKMKHKWASCSTTGWVSFNTDLLKESEKFQKYVILHELLHLNIPNHGKLFSTMMNIYLPDWENKYVKKHKLAI